MEDNFEVLEDGTINYNLQTLPASEYAESFGGYTAEGDSVVGEYPPSQGYNPSAGGYNPSVGGYPASQGGYPVSEGGYGQDCEPPSTRPQSSRHEYAI